MLSPSLTQVVGFIIIIGSAVTLPDTSCWFIIIMLLDFIICHFVLHVMARIRARIGATARARVRLG